MCCSSCISFPVPDVVKDWLVKNNYPAAFLGDLLVTDKYSCLDSYSVGTLVAINADDEWCNYVVVEKFYPACGVVVKEPTCDDINMMIILLPLLI